MTVLLISISIHTWRVICFIGAHICDNSLIQLFVSSLFAKECIADKKMMQLVTHEIRP